jgi:hypothetical protein
MKNDLADMLIVYNIGTKCNMKQAENYKFTKEKTIKLHNNITASKCNHNVYATEIKMVIVFLIHSSWLKIFSTLA